MTNPTGSYFHLTNEVSTHLAGLRKGQPLALKGFSDMARAAMMAGELSAKNKELIALAIGVATHCDACIGFHAKALVGLGATRNELEETLAVAVYMGGGPSLMYSANAIAAFEEFGTLATQPA
jgi:AhpD family alkylhydroperoxidase